ncbi:uncharacterized protein VDAG_07664 [Verticillium dahliae VdLs.17]|uniref:Metallo-beta-lactamase domain-containing protein n=1 Tax=Verticillium dahliae (strain VdLs.17 / ATCC MYA-4575 / FGSC 10137) TaxID=498257 RepID=G2XBY2_VERDV|nr:uncharacterized protein VDAG_07664 [Verticillium dahliae VdLs.17]EGY16500.1 hypothetical protein VDAG_07664 [Verticillium dahliae VdLs.17]
MFPTWFKSNYNYNNVIADFTVREVLINSVASTAFEVNGDPRPENVPTKSSLYSSTEVGGFFESAVWKLLVIRWVKEKIRKPIKYPSHHHHDHIWGIKDYVKAGAKVLIVDIASDYYSAIPRDKFVAYPGRQPTLLDLMAADTPPNTAGHILLDLQNFTVLRFVTQVDEDDDNPRFSEH